MCEEFAANEPSPNGEMVMGVVGTYAKEVGRIGGRIGGIMALLDDGAFSSLNESSAW